MARRRGTESKNTSTRAPESLPADLRSVYDSLFDVLADQTPTVRYAALAFVHKYMRSGKLTKDAELFLEGRDNMTDKLQIGLVFKERGPVVTAFSDEYVITVSRPDGSGLTEIEAKYVLQSYIDDFNARLKQQSKKARNRIPTGSRLPE